MADRSDAFSLSWLGQHLSHEGYEKMLKDMAKKAKNQGKKKTGPTKEEVGNEWKRLQAFMAGKK